MIFTFDSDDLIRRALHPLDLPPHEPAANLSDLADVLQGRQLRPAAVLMPMIWRQSWHLVLTQRTENLAHHPGQISFPGGSLESEDLTPMHAALREAEEEIGLERSASKALGYLDGLATITGFHVYPVVAIAPDDFKAKIDYSEVADVFEVPLEFLLDPANEQTREVEFQGRARQIFEYNFGERRIWGATASIIRNLRLRLDRL